MGLRVRAQADHHFKSILQLNQRFIKSLLRIGLNSCFGFCWTQTLSDPADKALRARRLGRPRKHELERGDGGHLGERSTRTGLARLGQHREVRAMV
jgi:hypothetical protein